MTNLELLKMRAHAANNDRQHNKMVLDKLKGFHRALLYSYQSTWVKSDADEEEYRALINPDKVKFDYDEKIISIDPSAEFAPGISFEWPLESGIHWLILKQELTEIAYFRGNVRRCQLIEAEDEDTFSTKQIWAAIRGPVETKTNEIQKAGITADVPNMSLNIYVQDNEFNRKYFDRYKKFYFCDRYWEVQAPDMISTPGIMEITAVETYECHGDKTLIPIQNPNPLQPIGTPEIMGTTFVKPLSRNTYTVVNYVGNKQQWTVELVGENSKGRMEDVLDYFIDNDNNSISVKWTAMISGSYILKYGNLTKTIVVESLF